MIHVTNGDHAAELIRAARPGEDVLPWRDVLHDGPVPSGVDDEGLRQIRARFLSGEYGPPEEDIRADLAARDAALAAAEAVALWFEHDLYDQLQLLQVLDRLARRSDHPRVEAIDPPTYLGHLDTESLQRLFDSRREVPRPAFALASAAWAAFRSPDPTAIEEIVRGNTGALPHLGAALRRFLEEYPAVGDGLSRTERQALASVTEGARTVEEAFHLAHHAREEAFFLGDAGFVSVLDRLSDVPSPLLRRADELVVTEAGRFVLAGEADHVTLNGVDRWLGGVHLEGLEAAWRWDAGAGRLIAAR